MCEWIRNAQWWLLPECFASTVVLLRPNSKSERRHRLLRGHASHERYTVPNVYTATGIIQAGTHPSTNPSRRCLTSVIESTPMSQRRLS